MKNIGLNNDALNKIINDVNNHRQYELPPSWYGFNSIKLFTDFPMYLFIIGTVKRVTINFMRWLRHLNQNPNYLVIAKGVLGKVKILNIEWCKTLEYPTTDKTGGWGSENFLVMAGLGSCFYSLLQFLTPPK